MYMNKQMDPVCVRVESRARVRCTRPIVLEGRGEGRDEEGGQEKSTTSISLLNAALFSGCQWLCSCMGIMGKAVRAYEREGEREGGVVETNACVLCSCCLAFLDLPRTRKKVWWIKSVFFLPLLFFFLLSSLEVSFCVSSCR